MQDLDGHPAVVFQVLSEIDGRHAARADFTLDAVAVGQRRGQAGSVGHRGLIVLPALSLGQRPIEHLGRLGPSPLELRIQEHRLPRSALS